MIPFRVFLKEETDPSEGKLKHITHAEDHPLFDGAKGFKKSMDVLRQASNHIKSGGNSSALTMKYDGSPAMVFGHDPESGKFFVATKSAFNVSPKINYTHEDIEKNHGKVPGLANHLHQALNHLKKIAPKTGVYQGDYMFGENDKQQNKRGISFKPNTITYTAKGDEAEKIANAKMGVVVHTQYHGDTLGNMKADPYPDTHNFTQHPDVWMKPATYDTRHVHYSEEDQKKFEEHLAKAQAIHDKYGKEMYTAVKPHSGPGNYLDTYMNETVRTGEKPNHEGLKNHITKKYQDKIAKLKTPAAQGRYQAELKNHLNYIEKNKNHYNNLFKMHHHLQEAKGVLVNTLNQHEGGLEHHVGSERTDPEGFVVNHNGTPTKLVNRAEFSRLNFLKQKQKQEDSNTKEPEVKKEEPKKIKVKSNKKKLEGLEWIHQKT